MTSAHNRSTVIQYEISSAKTAASGASADRHLRQLLTYVDDAQARWREEVPTLPSEVEERMNSSVCCVMLACDRQEMARRAVRCFKAQDYIDKMLLIWDTGDPSWFDEFRGSNQMQQWTPQGAAGATIGALRNAANNSSPRVDIFAHWDSDDWSHPSRISEQVALLQSSGSDVVGYREMLFWRCGTELDVRKGSSREISEAWLYTNNDPRYCVGSSLCYWRKAWERQPFRDLMRGEDREFVKGLNSCGIASFGVGGALPFISSNAPRMICSIHGGNTAGYTEATLTGSTNWRRAPEWDEHCRRAMQL